jgi:hypothetical protein
MGARRQRCGRGSLRPLRSKIDLLALDRALKQPDVEVESGCCDHDHGQEESADANGSDIDGDELHDCLHG